MDRPKGGQAVVAVLDLDRLGPEATIEMSERRIIGFRQDGDQEWVADLECGHAQHVRHAPPWQVRPWVMTAEGRAGRIGSRLPCRRCDASEGGRGR